MIVYFFYRVGGSIPLVWSYFAEFQPARKRGQQLSALATFWMIGNITVAGIAWAIIPSDIGLNPAEGFKYNSWRIFVAICGLPAFLVTIALYFLPESPKFLLSKGREYEALKIFRSIYAKNTGRLDSDYPVNHIEHEIVNLGENDIDSNKVYEMIQNTFELFKKPLVWITLMMLYINFSIQFG